MKQATKPSLVARVAQSSGRGSDYSGLHRNRGHFGAGGFLPRPSISSSGLLLPALCVGACLMSATACRRSVPAGAADQSGDGPEQYSARLVRTTEREGRRDTVESQISVSGQCIREDWTEQGEKRALIIRPDLGEAYLLFPDRAEFEVRLLDGSSTAPATGSDSQLTATTDANAVDPVVIERDLSPAATPAGVTSLPLADAVVDNHPCKVFEKRFSFQDGAVEATRTYRATDLAGLIIRVESESIGTSGSVRVITEKRDLHIGVVPGIAEIPAGYRRIR